MKNKKLIDSFSLLAYLNKEENHENIKALFKSDNVSVLINDIELGKTYYILARERSMEDADYFMNTILPTLPIKRVENTFQDVIDAAKIKAKQSIPFTNCFTVHTAIKESAPVVTGNPEFHHVEEMIKLESK